MEEKELFEDYEMRSWEFSPRIYKILGIAAVMNFLILLAFGQFNLLTARGCDTPYAGIVCQVLDSAYIASVFMDKGFKSDDIDYIKTELEDADITYIDVSDKLEYPEGYFALANPPGQVSEALPATNTDIAGFPNLTDPNNQFPPLPNSSGSDLITKPPITPTPNKEIEKQESADSPFVFDNKPAPRVNVPRVKPTPKPAKNNPLMSNESPSSLGGPVAKATPKKTPQPTPEPTPTDTNAVKDEFNKKFNRKPLQDFADGIVEKVDSKDPAQKVDLKQAFTVVLDGTLTKEGKFDTKKTKFTKGEGSEQMVNVAKSAIEAIGDSKIFSYLQELGVEKVNVTLVQDDKQISAIIRSSQPSEASARTVSSGFNLIMGIAQKTNADDGDVKTLLEGLKFQPDGKSFIINFAMPKDAAHQLIDKKLQEARQKKSQTNNDEGKQANANSK